MDSNSDSEEEVMNEEVYMMRNVSCEEVDSDDLEGDMNYSDDESNARQRVEMKKINRKQRKQGGKKAKASKYYVEVDTNVYQISLDCLNAKTEIATGDAEFCKGCQGVMNF